MGRKSKEEGIYEYLWLIHFTVYLRLGQHCKATIIKKIHRKRILKINSYYRTTFKQMEKQRFRICWVPHNPHSTPIWVGLHFRPFPSSLIFLRKSLGNEQTVQTFPVIWVSEVWVPGGLWFSRLPTTRQDGRTDSPGAAELGDLWELRHLQAEDFVVTVGWQALWGEADRPFSFAGVLEVVGGASLVAQWQRICLPMQKTRVRSLICKDPTCQGATKPMGHNYWACALEPGNHFYWSLHALKPMPHNKRSDHNEKASQHN